MFLCVMVSVFFLMCVRCVFFLWFLWLMLMVRVWLRVKGMVVVVLLGRGLDRFCLRKVFVEKIVSGLCLSKFLVVFV